MSIPLVDLKTQTGSMKEELMERISSVLDSCQYVLGNEVKEFEAEFSKYIGCEYTIGVGSGTDALHLAFRAAGVGPGVEVIVPAHTFIATALGVSMAGGTPVFVDVNENDFLMDLDQVEKKITPRTKVIAPVHLYGRVIDLDRMRAICEKHKLILIEDAAQAHGAQWKGHRAGTFGRMSCFSFFPGKNLGAFGDGGAVTTNDLGMKEKIEALRNYGSPQKYHHPVFGTNSRLDTIQAAILRVKLRRLDGFNNARRELAAGYNKKLASVGDLILPEIPSGESHVFHLYVIRTKRRDQLLKHLNDKGVGAGIHYPFPCHLQGAYSHLGYKEGSLPVTEKLAKEILSLPVYPEMTMAQQDVVVKTVQEFF